MTFDIFLLSYSRSCRYSDIIKSSVSEVDVFKKQNQLRAILLNTGFPEECLLPQAFNFRGPDAKLDVVC